MKFFEASPLPAPKPPQRYRVRLCRAIVIRPYPGIAIGDECLLTKEELSPLLANGDVKLCRGQPNPFAEQSEPPPPPTMHKAIGHVV